MKYCVVNAQKSGAKYLCAAQISRFSLLGYFNLVCSL